MLELNSEVIGRNDYEPFNRNCQISFDRDTLSLRVSCKLRQCLMSNSDTFFLELSKSVQSTIWSRLELFLYMKK